MATTPHPALLPGLARQARRPPPTAGWARPDRAPALRRYALRLEAAAKGSPDGDRLRRLARDCRLRAVELELGPQARDELRELADTMQAIGVARAA